MGKQKERETASKTLQIEEENKKRKAKKIKEEKGKEFRVKKQMQKDIRKSERKKRKVSHCVPLYKDDGLIPNIQNIPDNCKHHVKKEMFSMLYLERDVAGPTVKRPLYSRMKFSA